jgi:hypothetical protein
MPQPFFQRFDMLADCALSDTQFIGCLGKTAVTGDGLERP